MAPNLFVQANAILVTETNIYSDHLVVKGSPFYACLQVAFVSTRNPNLRLKRPADHTFIAITTIMSLKNVNNMFMEAATRETTSSIQRRTA